MHRKEYDEALAILTKGRYPTSDWDGGYEIQAAKELEKRYPEEILKYYLSGLGNLKVNATRKEYAHKAKVMAKVRHLLVEVLEAQPVGRLLLSRLDRIISGGRHFRRSLLECCRIGES